MKNREVTLREVLRATMPSTTPASAMITPTAVDHTWPVTSAEDSNASAAARPESLKREDACAVSGLSESCMISTVRQRPGRGGPRKIVSMIGMRLVVMVSGSGTNLQAIIDALHKGDVDVDIVAVGADKPCVGLERAEAAGIDTFLVPLANYPEREQWNRSLERAIANYNPDRVVFAGFMRIVDAQLVERFAGRIINTHPSLLPSFPGAHAVRDAMNFGVKVTGATVHEVVADVDAGPILAQVAVPVRPEDTEESLHERIKSAERGLLVNALAALSREVNFDLPIEEQS